MTEVGLFVALLGGVLSFLSPCVLPLVPPYLSYVAGLSAKEGAGPASRKIVLLAAMSFVLGFSTVFTLMGATATLLGQALRQWFDILSITAGIAIIAMGLHFLGLRIAFLYREVRFRPGRISGLGGAYVMGFAFAFGWTPCIGPILATILAIAGTEEAPAQGAALLAAYALGIGVPFLIVAAAAQSCMRVLARIKASMTIIEKVTGALLVLTGIAFLAGWMEYAALFILDWVPSLGELG